jgi:ribosomal-protein-alanine N-acetyltransferase
MKPFMQIITQRLRLREFESSDWLAVLAYQSDPRYLRFYPWEDRTEQDVQEFVDAFLVLQKEQPRLNFQLVVEVKGEGKLIGNCGIRIDEPGGDVANIGYEIDPEYWRHGYATEAAAGIVNFGFLRLKMQRIWAECLAENRASARVLEKTGLQKSVFKPKQTFIKGRWHDQLIYTISYHEWLGIASIKTNIKYNI